jgi:hypothetical protein
LEFVDLDDISGVVGKALPRIGSRASEATGDVDSLPEQGVWLQPLGRCGRYPARASDKLKQRRPKDLKKIS